MVTTAQNSANLRSAERVAAIALGLDLQDGSPLVSLTYQQRAAYLPALSAVILQYPDRFTPATLATARGVAGKTYDPLSDPAFDWEQFAAAVVVEAVAVGESVAAVGEGVKTGLNLTRYLIPLGVLAVAWVGYLALRKRANV